MLEVEYLLPGEVEKTGDSRAKERREKREQEELREEENLD